MGGYPGGHPAGPANFTFYDGHSKSLKWAMVDFPLNQNKWNAATPNPNLKNGDVLPYDWYKRWPVTYEAPDAVQRLDFILHGGVQGGVTVKAAKAVKRA